MDCYFSFYAGIAAVFFAIILCFYLTLRWFTRRVRVDCPPNTVLLHQFKPGPYAPSASPFPLKLETYLRVAKISYKNDRKYMRSKKGKTPWITYNDEDVADSHFSIQYLNKKLGIDINKNLGPEERAVATAIRVLAEEHLYWFIAYFRWVYDTDTEICRFLASGLMLKIATLAVKLYLFCQGIGRHSAEEIKSLLLSDLQVLQDQLGTKSFMMGEEITEVDCSVFGMLAQMIWHAGDDVCKGLIQEKYPSLHQYCLRIKEQAWPDWDKVCKDEQ